MLKFYNDRKQTFECKVKVEGTEKGIKDANVRLVFEDGNVQRFYKGKLDILGNCLIELPPLIEHQNKSGKVSLEVRIGDVIFEPYKNNYTIEKSMMKIDEVSVSDKRKLLKNGVDRGDLKIVKEMLSAFNKLDSKNKTTLHEYINLMYEPKEKSKKWASKVFNDLDDIKAKIVMYEIENIFNKH